MTDEEKKETLVKRLSTYSWPDWAKYVAMDGGTNHWYFFSDVPKCNEYVKEWERPYEEAVIQKFEGPITTVDWIQTLYSREKVFSTVEEEKETMLGEITIKKVVETTYSLKNLTYLVVDFANTPLGLFKPSQNFASIEMANVCDGRKVIDITTGEVIYENN